MYDIQEIEEEYDWFLDSTELEDALKLKPRKDSSKRTHGDVSRLRSSFYILHHSFIPTLLIRRTMLAKRLPIIAALQAQYCFRVKRTAPINSCDCNEFFIIRW